MVADALRGRRADPFLWALLGLSFDLGHRGRFHDEILTSEHASSVRGSWTIPDIGGKLRPASRGIFGASAGSAHLGRWP